MTRNAGKGLLAGMGMATLVGLLLLIPHRTQAQYASPVQIMKNADNPAKMPYSFGNSANYLGNATSIGFSAGGALVVPAGERLVIDLVTVKALMNNGDIPYIDTCGEAVLGAPQFTFPLLGQPSSGLAAYSGTLQGPIYIEAGDAFNVFIARIGTAGLSNDSVVVAVSGHFVTLP
jgi:hypothetical protein